MKTKHIIIGIIAVVAIYFLFFRGKRRERVALPPIGTNDETAITRHNAEAKEIFADKELYEKCDWMAEEKTGRSFCEIDGKKVYFDEVRPKYYKK